MVFLFKYLRVMVDFDLKWSEYEKKIKRLRALFY